METKMVKLVKYKCIFHCDLHVVQVFWVKDSIIMQYQIHLYMGASIKQTKKNIRIFFLTLFVNWFLPKLNAKFMLTAMVGGSPAV